MVSSSRQDAPAPPPPDRRCTGTVTSHMATEGQRCQRWTLNGSDTCYDHSGKSRPPSAPPEERRCRGFSKDENGKRTRPCKLWAMQGLNVCYRHGGARKGTRAAGERRVAEDRIEKKARRLAELFDVEPVDNPLEALATHVGEEILFKDVLACLVKDLRAEDIRYTDARGAEQLRSEIVVYERALGRVGDRLVAYARLNIDERLAAIEEKQAEAIIRAVEAALAHAGITGRALVEARQVAAAELRAAA